MHFLTIAHEVEAFVMVIQSSKIAQKWIGYWYFTYDIAMITEIF